ncbi:MAG: tRNA (adenosine(37)-N6)-threonylcarbamoyltransferase complex transferase subunit TsaD [Acholeplasmataceae bacterium]
MIILAIESSCDETSVAILENERNVLSHALVSQIDIFKSFGGVVPEMASRNHVPVITRLIHKAISDTNIDIKDINAVAVTKGPGLIGSLLVGINAATAFAYAHNIPLIGINHLAGHIYSANLIKPFKFPLIALLISGGHTELIYMQDHMQFEVIGETLDDAVGEAYDKVAKMLGLGYPGGPLIDQKAILGKDTYKLPRPKLESQGLNFSFSGLKSSVANIVGKEKENIQINNMCASFQTAVLDVIDFKLEKAFSLHDVEQLLVVGGVAANKGLRQMLQDRYGLKDIVIPPLNICTDNAIMIAAAAYHQLKHQKQTDTYILGGQANLSL